MTGAAGAADGRREDGVAAVSALGLTVVLVLVALVCGQLAALVNGQRRAQSGADLAALAGAGSLSDGGDPCRAAGRLATANQVQLVACAVVGDSVRVVVRVERRGPFGVERSIRARARAGPSAGG